MGVGAGAGAGASAAQAGKSRADSTKVRTILPIRTRNLFIFV